MLSAGHASAPLVIRVTPSTAASVSGICPAELNALYGKLRSMWLEQTEKRLDRLWLAGGPVLGAYPWADRASALARHGEGGTWGSTSARWATIPPAPPPPGSGDTCSVCFDDFSDPFPLPDRSARAPGWLFACELHATCIDCDEDQQRSHIAHGTQASFRCPLCRADRLHWTL